MAVSGRVSSLCAADCRRLGEGSPVELSSAISSWWAEEKGQRTSAVLTLPQIERMVTSLMYLPGCGVPGREKCVPAVGQFHCVPEEQRAVAVPDRVVLTKNRGLNAGVLKLCR